MNTHFTTAPLRVPPSGGCAGKLNGNRLKAELRTS